MDIGVREILAVNGGIVERAANAGLAAIARDLIVAPDIHGPRSGGITWQSKIDPKTGAVITQIQVLPVKLPKRETSFVGKARKAGQDGCRLTADAEDLGIEVEEEEVQS